MNKSIHLMAIIYSICITNIMNKTNNMMSKIMIMNNSNMNLMLMSIITFMMISSHFKSKSSKNKMNELTLYLIMALLSMMVFSCNEMTSFFILFEITIIPMFLIMSYFSKEKEKIKAMFFMVVTNMMFSLPFLSYVMFTKMCNKSTNMENLKMMSNQYSSLILFSLMSIMLLTKYPMFFFHSWLPKAHVEASTSGSMILASILLKLGTMGMEKNMMMMQLMAKKTSTIMKMTSINGMIVSSLIAIRCLDLKKMLAISSISHMAMVLYNMFLLKMSSMEQSKMMMMSHGIISPLMFMSVGKIYENMKSRSIFSSKNLESFNKTMSMLWFIILMMNIGLPPMMNVLSEIMMVSSMMSENQLNFIPLSIFLIMSSSISMMFIMKMNNLKKTKINSAKEMESWSMLNNSLMGSIILLNMSHFN